MENKEGKFKDGRWDGSGGGTLCGENGDNSTCKKMENKLK